MKNSPVLLQETSRSQWSKVRLVATDMDGTLTQAGHFTPALLRSLHRLKDSQILTLIVTGRSAGWVQGIAHYLPIDGAIAENGGLFVDSASGDLLPLVDLPDVGNHRQQLGHFFTQLKTAFPDLAASADNRFRLTDWTFDVGDLSADDLSTLHQMCSDADWGFTYSTVQCHIRLPQQDKGVGLQRVLQRQFSAISPAQVVTVGDSPNDEGLFDPTLFPMSVGVANVQHYIERLHHLPAVITQAAEVQGFQELVQAIAQAPAETS